MKNLSIDIRRFATIIYKHNKLALYVSCSIFALVVITTIFSTRIYEGSVQVIIERTDNDNLSTPGRSQTKDPEYVVTQLQLIRSHAVAKRVVSILSQESKLIFTEKTTLVSDLKEILSGWLRALLPSKTENKEENDSESWTKEDKLAAEMVKNIRVKPVEGSNIIEISYLSPNPKNAATVANTYVKAYIEETLEIKMAATKRNLDWMTKKAEEERLKLQASEDRLQKYINHNNLVTIEERVTIIPEQLTQIGRDLVLAETRSKEQKLLYDKLQSVASDLDAADSVLSISEGSSLGFLREQILRAEQNNRELGSKYGFKHPIKLKSDEELNALKDKHRYEVDRIIQKVKNQYHLALAYENSIRSQLNMIKSEAMGQNEKYLQYRTMKREIDTNRQIFDALLTKIKDQSITGETRPVNLWVVQAAKIPDEPIRPMVALNLLLGLLIGCFLGVSSAFLAERLDNRIKSPDGLDEILGVPTLGSITIKHRAEAMNDIVLSSPRSEFAESYNALRTTLLLSSPHAPPKRILITSSIATEGKSTTAVNLALAMAKTGTRVLLIDGDLRKGSLHKLFKLPAKVGLSSYLAGAASEQAVICKGSHDNLAVITAGPTPPNPYELLNSGRMGILLDKIKDDFDMVICDSPPILSVSDPRVLSKYFEGVVLVTRGDLTTYQMAHKSIRMLQHVNARILGTFVNGVHAREQEYYRYYSSYLEETRKPEVV